MIYLTKEEMAKVQKGLDAINERWANLINLKIAEQDGSQYIFETNEMFMPYDEYGQQVQEQYLEVLQSINNKLYTEPEVANRNLIVM